MNNDECCPKFQPERWDKKELKWDNKLFVKDSMITFFHVPLPGVVSKKIGKMSALIEAQNKYDANKADTLVLFRDPSPFKSEIYISTIGEVGGANNVKISGNFIACVYDGGYNMVPKFIKETETYLKSIGKKAMDYYIHYAYCPACTKKFGANYMVFFALVN
jgi:hypothetical protein